MLNVAFFTEAGDGRGLGHLVRSYTIYKKFKEQANSSVTLFLDSNTNYDAQFSDVSYFSWQTLVVKKQYDIIFVDSYEAELQHYVMLQKHCRLCIYIDDYRRLEYPAGVIINFAPDAEALFYKEKKNHYNYLLGIEYLPIRQEFSDISKNQKKQIFIMLGGSDNSDISLKIVKSLQKLKMKKVVVNSNKEIVKELQKQSDVEVLTHPSDKLLIQTMTESSLAISTASMSSYELAVLKIPTIVLALQKNQEIGISQLLKHNIAAYAISLHDANYLNELKKKILLIEDNIYSINKQIDTQGSRRIYKQVMELLK